MVSLRGNAGGNLWMGLSAGVFAVVGGAPSYAADKLAVGPTPVWVAPVAVPADNGKAGDSAIKVLLRDEQADLEPGKVDRFIESVFKVQTPQGLPAGAVSLTWNPDTQSATVHKLLIRRGTQVIDVLASGQSFTVLRRETNLENAVLDGQLTASIEPEGLQVGDIVDFSVSILTKDPAVGNHVEQAAATWNGIPFERAHLRVQWPSSVPMRIQPDGGLPMSKVQRKDGRSAIEFTMDGLQPLVLPKGAPLRYQLGRLVEMTDFASWQDLVAVMAPLYAKAETTPAGGPLQTEIAKIKAASSDPKVRAEAALALVQDRVRYMFLGMNDGGIVPADAETTWSRRFGDCKGKTVLLLALLHALGIDAHPVLVSTALGDGLDKRLPEIALFDHVLVEAKLGGRSYWLDGTRLGDRSLDGIETPFFHWGLPLVPGNGQLVAMVPPPLDKPQISVAIRIDATGGLGIAAPLHIERTMRGDSAVATNLALANLVGDARDRALREFWKSNYDFAVPTSVTTSFDPVKRALVLAMDGTTKMDWSQGWYEADHVWVGYTADFTREPDADKDAPYAVGYPVYTHVTETILLPSNTGRFTLTSGSEVDQTVAGIDYHRHATIEGDRFTVEQSDRSIAQEFPASQAPAAQETLRALAKKGVFINRPANYIGTAAEISAKLAETPTTAAGLLDQGNLLLVSKRYQDSVDRFTRALALDPKNAVALGDRGIARTGLGDDKGAAADFDAAQAIDPHNAVMLRGRAQLAEKAGRYADEIDLLTASLESEPGNDYALDHRAQAYYAAGRDDLALADATTLIGNWPTRVDMYLLRANVMRRKGDLAATAHEADALAAANPKDVSALVTAGRIYAASGRQDAAMRSINAALAIKPSSYVYINRFYIRPKSDIAGRKADVDAAVKLDPRSSDVGELQAAFLSDRGDWRGAAAVLSTVIAAEPSDIRTIERRGIAYAKAGDQALADKDFDTARAAAKIAADFNNLCWSQATADVALDRALAECDVAVRMAPDKMGILDSRAFVLLRLGRIDEALAVYDQVLAKAPTEASSLYGRAIIRQRKGDHANAVKDMNAALKADPDTRERFEGYGMPFAS